MRRLLLLATLPLMLFACSYEFEARTSLDAEPLTLDEVTATQSYQVRVCWEGAGEPSDVELAILATVADDAGAVSLEIAEQVVVLGSMAPAEFDAPAERWSGETLDDACDVGSTITFVLTDPAAGPLDVDWSVAATARSGIDEAVESLELTIFIDPV